MRRIDFPLYLVTDRALTRGRSLASVVDLALNAGVRAVQLRERDLPTPGLIALAQALLGPVRERGASLLINDRVDVAMALSMHGVHLRADSLPVAVTRRVAGDGPLIGASAHSVEEVLRAEGEGADFIVLGPVYETPSKRDYGPPLGLKPLEEAARRCRIPVFAIGGISASRVREVRRAGAFGIAVVSAILAADDVEAATRELIREATQSCV